MNHFFSLKIAAFSSNKKTVMTDKKIAANCLNNIMYFFQNGKKTIDK